MTLEEKNVVRLCDGCEYFVTHKIEVNGDPHYFLVDINDQSNIKVCFQSGDDLVEIEGEKIDELIPLFAERSKEILPKEVIDKLEGII